jgi:hypothetical protein
MQWIDVTVDHSYELPLSFQINVGFLKKYCNVVATNMNF